jgi:ATP-grasp ribosomal peptide maturase
MILILTQELDPHADFVIEELNRRDLPVLRLHTEDFPQRCRLVAEKNGKWSIELVYNGRPVDLASVTGVWYRRPTPFAFAPTLTAAERQYAQAEATMAMGGLLKVLDCVWVNPPDRMAVANYKPYQLEVAGRRGLRTPRTLVTNDPEAFRRFFQEAGPSIIYKTLSFGAIEEPGNTSIIYTTRVDEDQVDALAPRVRHTACLFQEYVAKRLELRVTVMGDDVYCVALDSQSNETTQIDWRKDTTAVPHSVFDLPAEVARQCRDVVADLGLAFGAIDLIVTPSDEIVFLEINPGGQWVWLETGTGLPIRDSLIRLLSGSGQRETSGSRA